MTEKKFVRALSSGDILAYEEATLKSRAAVADRPVHKMTESYLSTESGFTNFRGFVNWGLILLLIFGGKMVLNNFNRYGIIMDPFLWRYIVQGEHFQSACLAFVAFVNVYIFIGFFIECIMSRFALPQSLYIFFVSLNLFACIMFPTIVVLANDWSPFFTSPALMLYIIVFLKLWSYAMVNTWCRTARAKGPTPATNDPKRNLNLSATDRMHLLANAAHSGRPPNQHPAPNKGAHNPGIPGQLKMSLVRGSCEAPLGSGYDWLMATNKSELAITISLIFVGVNCMQLCWKLKRVIHAQAVAVLSVSATVFCY